MENVLEYHYDLRNIKIEEKEDYYLINDSIDQFIFQEIYVDEKELKRILDLLNNTDILYHLVVYTKDEKLIVSHLNKKYVLLKIRKKDNDFTINDFQKVIVSGNVEWGKLWSERIDYYERQVTEVIKNVSLKYSIQYYIGLCENAISYVNYLKENIKNDELVYSICHRKVDSPLNKITFFNPLNLMIDINVRDLSEYIKSSFFNEILTNSEILNLVNKIHFDRASANYFFARLLYPSYFFYEYDKYIDTGVISEQIILMIKKSSEYELLLKSIYEHLIIKNEIFFHGWIIKSLH